MARSSSTTPASHAPPLSASSSLLRASSSGLAAEPRPSTIAELSTRARADLWDPSKDMKHWLRLGQRYRLSGKQHAEAAEYEDAFVDFARAATIVLDKLPQHRDYMAQLTAPQRHNLGLNGQEILDNLSRLKPLLVERHERWAQKYPDLARQMQSQPTPVPAQAPTPSPQSRRQTSTSDDERVHARLEGLRVSDPRQTSSQFYQPQQQPQQQQQADMRRREDDMAMAQRRERERAGIAQRQQEADAAARYARDPSRSRDPSPVPPSSGSAHMPMAAPAPAYGQYASASAAAAARSPYYAQPPPPAPAPPPPPIANGHGNSHSYVNDPTHVAAREGIARRQQESEAAARAARSSAAPPPPAPHQPQPQYASQGSGSGFAQGQNGHGLQRQGTLPSFPIQEDRDRDRRRRQESSGGAGLSRHGTMPSSLAHTPERLGPPENGITFMPLESPTKYESDTDREDATPTGPGTGNERHRNGNTNEKGSAKRSRTPARAGSYPPPVTTTSPAPPELGPIRYPTLMTQHQLTQGYSPSLQSMFGPGGQAMPAPMPNSMLLMQSQPPPGGGGGGGGGGFYSAAQSMLPQPSAPVQPPYSSSSGRPRDMGPGPPGGTIPGLGRPRSHSHISAYATSTPTAPPPVPNVPPPPALSRIESGRHEDPVKQELKQVTLPRECLQRFLSIASINTSKNKETCGLLLGKDRGGRYAVTTLLIPKQHSTSDTCTMDEEELVLMFTEERGLITLGWIHTHPSQSCFMSSVDLHTHSGFQRMLPESFAVVCAPKHTPNFGIFRLTDPPGLQTILTCTAKEAFHPHADVPIYTDADKGHVVMKEASLEIVDLR